MTNYELQKLELNHLVVALEAHLQGLKDHFHHLKRTEPADQWDAEPLAHEIAVVTSLYKRHLDDFEWLTKGDKYPLPKGAI
jgi:hypothetical protein